MDIKVMYGDTTTRTGAIMKYKKELQSRGVLLLVKAATQLYNLQMDDNINLMVWKAGYTEKERIEVDSHNCEKLMNTHDYNRPDIRLPGHPVKDLKSLLLKFWWMGYGQYPELADSELDSSRYLNWAYFKYCLRAVAPV